MIKILFKMINRCYIKYRELIKAWKKNIILMSNHLYICGTYNFHNSNVSGNFYLGWYFQFSQHYYIL